MARQHQRRRIGSTEFDTYASLWPDAEDATWAAVDDELGPRLVSPSCTASDSGVFVPVNDYRS